MMRTLTLALPLLLLFSPGAAVAKDSPGETPRPEAPSLLDDGWRTSSPEDLGLSSEPLEAMTQALRADDYPNVHAVLIAKDGKLVYEQYFEGVDRRWQEDGRRRDVPTTFDRDTIHELRSVTKSITSAVFGIAVADGAIGSLDQPLFGFFPEYANLATPEKRRITLRHALTMSAGLDWNEDDVPKSDPEYHETLTYQSSDPAGFVLARPLDTEPGQRWDYNSGLTTLLGIVIGRATGRSFGEYTRERLFEPLGIDRVEWGWLGEGGLGESGENAWKDIPELRWQGTEPWSNVASPPVSLWMRPRDLLKIGALYLNGGRWNGRQVLPETWVEESLDHRIDRPTPSREHGQGAVSHHGYGYQWWRTRYSLPYGEVTVHAAYGNGGQRIWVVPELGLTAVHLTGNYNLWWSSYQAERLLLERIVPWAMGIEATYRHEIARPVGTLAPGEWSPATLTARERARYVGSYVSDGERLRVYEEDGVLRIELPGHGSGAVDLLPEVDHVFATGLVEDGEPRKLYWPDERLQFVLDGEGAVERFESRVVDTGEVTSVGVRVESGAAGGTPSGTSSGPARPAPILDMHLHAKDAPDPNRELPPRLCLPVTVYGVADPQCADPLVAPATDEAMVERTVEILERRNVFGVISDDSLETVRRFREAAPNRLIPAYVLELDGDSLSPEELRRHFETGDFEVLGEIAIQYEGIAPDDERMEPYWALAEELDIPVALHLGEGYPGAPYLGSPKYRVRLGSPLLLEEVLVRHPDLRLYVMHYGSPLVDEMIAVMQTYPNVYIDIGGNTWPYPREYFYSQLKRFVDAGFGRRILFGSDQMLWPELIEISIEIVEEAPFLSEEQKRDILYHNAARFLRLSGEEIAQHHGRPSEREDENHDEK